MPNCPSCGGNNWEQDRPPLGAWGCSSCGSHVCPAPATKKMSAAAGINAETLGNLARDQSHRSKFDCPVCTNKMVQFPLKGATVHACLQDGLTFFRGGQLERLVPELAPMMLLGDVSGIDLDASRGNDLREMETSSPGSYVNVNQSAQARMASADIFGDVESSRPAPEAPSSPAAAPDAMTAPGQGGHGGLAFLDGVDTIQIRQRAKAGELLGIEQKNDYEIDAGMAGVGHALEEGGGAAGILIRQFMGARRPLRFTLQDPQGQPRTVVQRKFYWFLPKTTLNDSQSGRPIGTVQRRWSFLSRVYDLIDGQGRTFTQVKAGFFRVWKFPLVQPGSGQEVGEITKKSAGLLKEAFTDADNFNIKFGPQAKFTPEQRAVCVAAALGIDLDFFEKSSSSKSPAKILFSVVAFLGFLAFSMCGDGGGGSYSQKDVLKNAMGCYESAAGVADCEVCCLEGSVFVENSCHCLGVQVQCPDGNVDPAEMGELMDPAEGCRTCCTEAMDEALLGDVWLSNDGVCNCAGGYDPEMFGG